MSVELSYREDTKFNYVFIGGGKKRGGKSAHQLASSPTAIFDAPPLSTQFSEALNQGKVRKIGRKRTKIEAKTEMKRDGVESSRVELFFGINLLRDFVVVVVSPSPPVLHPLPT